MTTRDDIAAWFDAEVPDDWFTGSPQVTVDAEEVLVVGTLPEPGPDAGGDAAEGDRVADFREQTRDRRIRIAAEAEKRFGRKVSWGATAGSTTVLFTHVAAPVMTRLRQPERAVLDTLVEGGVARSRSEALAWCVKLVGRHEADWLADLRDALVHVQKVRAEGPAAKVGPAARPASRRGPTVV